CTDAEGNVYISISNKDWNPQPGFPLKGDDRILKISPAEKAVYTPLKAIKQQEDTKRVLDGAVLYKNYCASCHQDNGKGVTAVFPALDGSKRVNGNNAALIKALLNGISKKNSSQVMPSFSFLSDKELAAMLTYIRNRWTNNSSAITAQEVKLNR